MKIIPNIIELIENVPRVSHILIAEYSDNKPKSVQDLITRNIDDFREFGDLTILNRRVVNEGKGEQPKDYFLNEQQATLLMTYLRNSPTVKEFKKELVRQFFKIRETLNAKQNQFFTKEQIELEMIGLETAIKILRVNEASKILMTKKLYSTLGLETVYLPEYSDEQHTYSLSALLKKFDVKISAKKLNQLLISKGFLEVKTRKSTKEFEDEEGEKVKIRTFKSLTEKGLEFGKNLISPHNQLETQPHYFESRFRDMLGVLAIF
jgi:phage regulator Rha-like protein